ncbi:putative integral membrane protein [Leishmania donovani]|uniref:Putative integral membrane protein n=1 Tax=Leishmania donovani TaxID=5661 RepID=A0A504XMA4_LEIDO|nr:putative integral membrane protein [Leishmania donovani]
MTSSLSSSTLRLSHSATMGSTAAAAVTGATEPAVDVSLDEYFEPATRSVGPSSRDAAFGDRSSTAAALQHHHSRGRRNVKPVAAVAADLPTPLRGNVTRPLLQRPRPLRSPLLADVLISIPSTLEDEGLPPHDAAPSRPSTCPRPPFRKPEFVAPPHGSAAAFSRNGAAVRGSVFAFHPPPAGTAAARGKKRSSKTITTRGGAGACPSSTSPSTAPRAVAAAQVGCLARQRAVLFDVLCALRQHPTASCEMYSDKGDSRSSAHADLSLAPSGGPWRLRDAVLAEAAAKAWPLTFLGALEQLLEVANVVAAVDAHVRECEPALAHHTSRGPTEMHGAFAHDVTEMCGDVQDASVALEATAARSLERLCSVLRQLSADFGRWVLQLQEYLLVVCEGAAAASHLSEHQPPPPLAENVRAALYENEEEAPKAGGGRQYPFRAGSYIASSAGVAATVLPGSCSLADLVAAVRENIVPLQRCHVLVEESGCFEGLVSFDRQSSASRPTATTGAAAASGAGEEAPPRLLSCALLAARLLDTLIIQASAFQDTSTMDLYRLYVMTLLYTAWPYVLLCTAAIFGFVRGIDPPVWRRQLPRLFRSSFSHVRIGDASSRFPTDILSLLLNCVGYYNSDGVAASAAAGERGKGMAQRTSVPSSSGAGRSGDSVGAVWMPGPRQAGAGRSGRRRGEASEQHAARAALTSARAFVLRSLASFTRRHKQIALSRTPMHPRRTSAAPVGVKGHAATTAAAAARTSAGTAPCHLWHTKSMKEILHYIMYEAGDRQGDEPGAGDQAGSGTVAAVVAYAQQNQDVRCRVVQVAAPSTVVATVDATGSSNAGDSAGALHYVYFPTTIPLGFASMLAEALAGQQQWQQRRGDCRVSSSDTTPDVRFTNILAGEEEQYLDAADTGSKAFGQGGQAQRKRRSHQLWINVTIPCARWITTALLIPIGVAVQRLQERRLRDLFTLSLHADAGGGGSGCLLSRSLHAPVQEAQQQRQSTDTTAPAERPPSGSLAPLDELAGRGLVSRTATATACSFIQALKLLVDVALCRDQERLVHGFLERLHREPRWWVRHAEDGGAAAYGRLGTAAPVVSAIFADALRGKRFSELVRLSVLPARVGAAAAAVAAASTMTAATLTTPGQQGGRGEEGHSSPPVAADMLDVFASFQLDLTLPDAFQRILQPRDLSVYVQPLTSRTERSYQTYFWQRRQRLYLEEGDAGEGKASPAAAAASGLNGIAFADVWSYVFGYKCALYYARITLREHKKRLQQRDTQDAQAAQAMGLPGHTATQHLRYVSRGLGTAYYTLNFAVEQLLSFTQNVAMRVVYNLERLLAKAMSPSPELLSCMELCYQLDALLLELSIVSFPARPPVALNVRERGMQSPAAEVVRAAVQRALEVALDPSRLPVSHINISTRNAVEALVAAVFAAAESHPSTLATHLKPLVVRLTFNRYYGTDEEIRSFHFR